MPLLLNQHDLLVVSDLHLSEGRDPSSKQVSRLEDFLFDEEFARFLQYHMAQGDRRWHLIINGDFCDFLQVVSTDPDPAYCRYMGFSSPQQAYDALTKGDRPEYGFGSGPRETVYKLWRIMDGHWMFFEALSEFIAAGHVLSIGRGNHDPEFIYPEVQRAFREKLKIVYHDKLQRTQAANIEAAVDALARAILEGDSDSRLRFIDWFYCEPRLLWVEHGSQYDKLNSFDYWLAPFLPPMKSVEPQHRHDIDLPWGSLFVRYLFNQVEYDEAFADNVEPLTLFLGWFLRTHPLLAISFLSCDAPYMLKKMARAWRNPPPGAYDGCRHLHQIRLAEDARAFGVNRRKLQQIDAQKDPTILRHTRGFTWTIVKWLTRAWPASLTILFFLLIYLVITGAGVAARLLAPFAPLGRFRLSTTGGGCPCRTACAKHGWASRLSPSLFMPFSNSRDCGIASASEITIPICLTWQGKPSGCAVSCA